MKLRTAVLTLLTALGLVLALGVSAQAGTSISFKDKRNDVEASRDTTGRPGAQIRKSSVDIRRVTVGQDEANVYVTVALRDTVRGKRVGKYEFYQFVSVSFEQYKDGQFLKNAAQSGIAQESSGQKLYVRACDEGTRVHEGEVKFNLKANTVRFAIPLSCFDGAGERFRVYVIAGSEARKGRAYHPYAVDSASKFGVRVKH